MYRGEVELRLWVMKVIKGKHGLLTRFRRGYNLRYWIRGDQSRDQNKTFTVTLKGVRAKPGGGQFLTQCRTKKAVSDRQQYASNGNGPRGDM